MTRTTSQPTSNRDDGVPPLGQSLYQRLTEAGCTLQSHESDLYVRATARAAEIVRAVYGDRMPQTFRDAEGYIWFDCPFMFDPFWVGKGGPRGDRR